MKVPPWVAGARILPTWSRLTPEDAWEDLLRSRLLAFLS